jgi:hypothetical protein
VNSQKLVCFCGNKICADEALYVLCAIPNLHVTFQFLQQAADVCDQGLPEGGKQGAEETSYDLLGGERRYTASY